MEPIGRPAEPASAQDAVRRSHRTEVPPELVLIGASLGGPKSIARVLSQLPSQFPIPIVIIQHMPEGFTEEFANSLHAVAGRPVSEARDVDELVRGQVLIGKAGQHLTFERWRMRPVVRVGSDYRATTHMPSVDIAMASAAEVFGRRCVGVLLTGMGADGAVGMRALTDAGAYTIAEAESSAVVFGMPKAAIEAGGAVEVLDLNLIAHRLAKITGM